MTEFLRCAHGSTPAGAGATHGFACLALCLRGAFQLPCLSRGSRCTHGACQHSPLLPDVLPDALPDASLPCPFVPCPAPLCVQARRAGHEVRQGHAHRAGRPAARRLPRGCAAAKEKGRALGGHWAAGRARELPCSKLEYRQPLLTAMPPCPSRPAVRYARRVPSSGPSGVTLFAGAARRLRACLWPSRPSPRAAAGPCNAPPLPCSNPSS